MNHSYGSQSMIAPLRRVIVKRPQEAYRNQLNITAQWDHLGYTAPPDFTHSCEEYEPFLALLRQSGVEVLLLPEDERTGIDSIYTHDPCIVTDHGAILFQTGKEARRGESAAFADAFQKWGVPVLGELTGTECAEGGDLVWLDRNTLLAGRGFRTNAEGILRLRRLLAPLSVDVIEVPLPYWTGPGDCLHLMSYMSLLDTDLAVVYVRLMPVPLYELLKQRGIQMVEIPEVEYPTQACNVLAIAPRQIIMLKRNPVTRDRLADAGCNVMEFSGEEICLKGSGGPTCLTRPLLRTDAPGGKPQSHKGEVPA